jgi:hypothetical protein
MAASSPAIGRRTPLCSLTLLFGMICLYLVFKNYAAAMAAGNSVVAYGKTALGIATPDQAPPAFVESKLLLRKLRALDAKFYGTMHRVPE